MDMLFVRGDGVILVSIILYASALSTILIQYRYRRPLVHDAPVMDAANIFFGSYALSHALYSLFSRLYPLGIIHIIATGNVRGISDDGPLFAPLVRQFIVGLWRDLTHGPCFVADPGRQRDINLPLCQSNASIYIAKSTYHDGQWHAIY